jgi:quinol monooxygenase YgiN
LAQFAFRPRRDPLALAGCFPSCRAIRTNPTVKEFIVPVTVVAVLKVKPTSAHEARTILTRAVEDVHREPGCDLYTLHEGDGRFIFIEQWATEDALNSHNAGPVVQRMVDDIGEHLDGEPEITLARSVSAGDPAKGLLRP